MKLRIVYLDVLRIVAIFAVVLLHVVITPPNSFISDPQEWWLTIVYKSISLWCVPIFLMISGALLLKKDEPISIIFTKRLPKVLLPFMFWNLVYIYFDITHVKGHTFLGDLESSIVTPIIYHFWFIYTLIGLYIATPVIRVFLRSAKKTELEYVILLCFFLGTILPTIQKIVGYDLESPLNLFGYTGFYLLGFYVTTYPLSAKIRKSIYAVSLIGVPITIFGTYLLSLRHVRFDDFFLKPTAIPMILLSVAVFIFFQQIKFSETSLVARVGKHVDIGRICFGIYFSHVLALGILEGGKLGFSLTEKVIYPPVGVLLNTVVVLTLCGGFFLLLELLKKYRLIRFLSQFLY